MTVVSTPAVAADLFADAVLAHPYGAYRAIRDTGPAVYVPEHRLWVLSRYREVRDALLRPDVFAAPHGAGLLDLGVPAAAPPAPSPPAPAASALTAGFPKDLETLVVNQAEKLVDDLVSRGSFDAVADLAHPFPLRTIGDLIGLPADARTDLVTCAEASLQANAPLDERTLRALMDLEGVFTRLTTDLTTGPAASLTTGLTTGPAADPAPVPPCPTSHLLKTFAMPCVHTIASGLSAMLWLLATHPDAWHALRTTPSLVAAAVEESLRLETPVQMLTRTTTRDVLVGDTLIRTGDRVLLLIAAANRDPRKWPDPDHYDIRRNPTDHLSLGHGTQSHLIATLTKTHLRAILGALVHRASALYLDGSPRRRITPTTRAFASLPLYATHR